MAVAQVTPAPSNAAAARRAATAATVAANKAKAAASARTPASAPAAASTRTSRTTATTAAATKTAAPIRKPTTTSSAVGAAKPAQRTLGVAATASKSTPRGSSTTTTTTTAARNTTAAKPTAAKPTPTKSTTLSSSRTPLTPSTAAVRQSTVTSRTTTPITGVKPVRTPSTATTRSAMSAARPTTSTTSAVKKPPVPNAATSTTSKATPASAASAASRRTAATATTRTTTSIRVPPTSTGSAAKPPVGGGRAPPGMTQTTIRTTAPVRQTATNVALARKPVSSPAVSSPAMGRPKPSTTTTSRTGSMTPTARPGSATPTPRSGTATPTTATARARVTSTGASATALKRTSIHGAPSPAGGVRAAATPTTPAELKKVIANIQTKLEDASKRLKIKDEELAVLKAQLESGSHFDALTMAETASSDGGETLVPEVDLSKVLDQDKEIVAAAIAAKEKEVAKMKHRVRTLKARIGRLRLEHELKIKELIQKQLERQAEKNAALTSLRQELAASIQKCRENAPLRQKLDETLVLHATTVKELNRIHEDKLYSLAQELQAAKRERIITRSGATDQVQESYRLDLVNIEKTHQHELEQLLTEHQEEVDAVKARFEAQINQAVEEHEAELKERFDMELTQIKASHANLLKNHTGSQSGTMEMLQDRHLRALSELSVKVEKEHMQYLGTLQNKQRADISEQNATYNERVLALNGKIKALKEKHVTDMASLKARADAESEVLKKEHATEIADRSEKYEKELKALEISTKDKMQLELDEVQKSFGAFVADIQGKQDNAMRTLESGYETRIAELIVNHEDRVRELENDANERVHDALERVEIEFEQNEERMSAEQNKVLNELRTQHDATIESLEERLTNAEEKAQEGVDAKKKIKKEYEAGLSEVKMDLEAQLSAIKISIEALISNHDADNKSSEEAIQAANAQRIADLKSAYDKDLKEALAKKEATWKTRNAKVEEEIQKVRANLAKISSQRAQAAEQADSENAHLIKEHSKDIERLKKEHNLKVEQYKQRAQQRMGELTRTQEQNANTHEDKFADLMSSHHQELEAIEEQQEALLKAKVQEDKDQIVALKKTIENLKANSGHAAAPSQDMKKAINELAERKRLNEALKGEKEQLMTVMKQLQDAMSSM